MPDPSIFPDGYGTRENAKDSRMMVRSGYVVARQPATCSIKISQADRKIITPWIRVAQKSTVGSQEVHLPRLGEFVHLLHVPGGANDAIHLGSSYTDLMPVPPVPSADARYIRMDDGTEIWVDPNNKVFINAAGPIECHAAGPITFVTAGYAYIQCANAKIQAANTEITGNVTIDQNLEVKGSLTVDGGMAVSGTLAGATSTINGPLTVTGVTLLQGGGTATPHLSNSDGSGGGS